MKFYQRILSVISSQKTKIKHINKTNLINLFSLTETYQQLSIISLVLSFFKH